MYRVLRRHKETRGRLYSSYQPYAINEYTVTLPPTPLVVVRQLLWSMPLHDGLGEICSKRYPMIVFVWYIYCIEDDPLPST